MNYKEFGNTIKNFMKLLEQDLDNEVSSAFLVGSVAKNEHVLGWSNIDIVVVFNYKDRIPLQLLRKLRAIVDESSKKYEIPIWIKPFSLDDFPRKLSYLKTEEYKKDRVILLGEDPMMCLDRKITKNKIRLIKKEAKDELYTCKYQWQRCFLSINSVSPEIEPIHIIRRTQDPITWKKILVAHIIETAFEVAQLSLCVILGQLYTKRQEIVDMMSDAGFKSLSSKLSKLHEIRRNWLKVKDDTLDATLSWGPTFIDEIFGIA